MVATQVDRHLTELAAIMELLNRADTLRRLMLDTVNHRMARASPHKMTRRLTDSPRPHMANPRRHHTCNHLAIHRHHRHPTNRLPRTLRNNPHINLVARRHTRHHNHPTVVGIAINKSILLRAIHQLHLHTVVHRRTKCLLLTKCTIACISHIKFLFCFVDDCFMS